jgi:predicted ATP-grasp superfamily ATP-dependent carboligase
MRSVKVFLFDYLSRHAQAIIYSLRAHGYQVIVGTDSIPKYHFGVSQFLSWDGALNSLLGLLSQHDIQVVMPISIGAFRFCAEHKQSLLDRGIKLLVADLPVWLRLYNKAQTYELAARHGVPVPRSIALSAGNYREEISRSGLDFKLVIKGAEEGGARFVRYACSLDECDEILSDFRREDPDVFKKGVIAQEYIQGTGCAYFCLADQGRILAEFGHRRIHQNPPTGGVSTCCATFRNEQMFELGRKLVQKEGYSGPCMIEFKHDQQANRFVLIEVNPKFWGSSLLPILCGLSFPVLYVKHVLGEKLGSTSFEDHTLQFVLPDLARAVRHPGCLPGFLRMLMDPGIKKDIPYFGWMPYLRYYARR